MSKSSFCVVALGVLGCSFAFQMSRAQTPPDVPGTLAKRIEIKDFHFQPMTLTVLAGTKIVFINHDDEPHTVASVDGKFAKSKALDTDQEYTVVLTAPGDYGFFCTVHPTMTGKITVFAAPKP